MAKIYYCEGYRAEITEKRHIQANVREVKSRLSCPPYAGDASSSPGGKYKNMCEMTMLRKLGLSLGVQSS